MSIFMGVAVPVNASVTFDLEIFGFISLWQAATIS
jgi:hypothetical protein